MRTPTPHSARGFSIIETMVAMVVLAISLLGTLGALNRGATESRLGQTRQMKMMLADAALQRIKLQDKNTFFAGLPAQPTVNLSSLAVGASPWVQDPTSNGDPLDFSVGAYFNIQPDGTLVKLNIAGNPPCTDALVVVGTICREVYTHLGAPYNATNATLGAALPTGARIATAWVRVSRKTSATSRLDAEVDVLLNTVVVQ
jgi:prepilin-type N-terminal cleavage/methylation domain-containing protein